MDDSLCPALSPDDAARLAAANYKYAARLDRIELRQQVADMHRRAAKVAAAFAAPVTQNPALASRWDELYAAQYPDDDPDDYSPQVATPEIMQELRDAGYDVVPLPASSEFLAWRRDDFDPWYKEQSATWAAQDKAIDDMLAQCLAKPAPAPVEVWSKETQFHMHDRFKFGDAMRARGLGQRILYGNGSRVYEHPLGGQSFGTDVPPHVVVNDNRLFGYEPTIVGCAPEHAHEIEADILDALATGETETRKHWITDADIAAAAWKVRDGTKPKGLWHPLVVIALKGDKPDHKGNAEKHYRKNNPTHTAAQVAAFLVRWLDSGNELYNEKDGVPVHSPPAPTKTPTSIATAVWCMASDVAPEQLFWIVQDHLPLGTVVLLSGDTKVGKSQIALHWCACVTAGKDFAEDVPVTEDGRGLAVVISGEDSLESVVRPRTEAAGCDLSKVVFCKGYKSTNDNGKEIVERFSLKMAEGVIEDVLANVPGVKIVVIDPVNAFLGAECDAYMNNEIRALLNPLVEIARKHGITVLLVHHNAKHKQGKSLTSTVGGSNAWVEAVRSVWMVGRVNPDDPSQPECVLEQIAGNNGVLGQRYDYEVQGTTVKHGGMLFDTSLVVVGGNAEKSMAEINRGPGKGSKSEDAEDFLQVQLASGGKDAKELEALAKSTGISATTLKRARKRLGVVATKTQGTLGGGWQWSLPVGNGYSIRAMPPDSGQDGRD